jgi:biotin transport system substrate-specific component
MQITSRAPVLIDAVIPREWAQTRVQQLAMDFALMAGFAWFVALSAQIAVRLPWTTVPITGQTFAVLVAGGALGAKRGAGALIIYMLMGMAFIPVFAPPASALAMDGTWGVHFIFPWLGNAGLPWAISSGGYIVGFILAAYLTGLLAERSWDRKSWGSLAMLAGNAVIYIPGLLWLYFLIATNWVPAGAPQPIGEYIAGDTNWGKTLIGGLYPFIIGDLMKLYAASLVLPGAWALVKRLKKE